MHKRSYIAALILTSGLTACQEPPSYRLRWALADRGTPTVEACAESGLFEVRARAYLDGERFVGELTLPCASSELTDPQGYVDGSALPAGDYLLQLRGIDRAGDPWRTEVPADPGEEDAPDLEGCLDDASACQATELVCDCVSLQVREDATVDLPELLLDTPPECDDGIDNDQDGVVDGQDPSCEIDGGIRGEGLPVGLTELSLSLTLLGENPNATCSSVPLRRLQVQLEGETESPVVLDEDCQIDRPYLLSLRVPADTYTFSVTGLDRECDEELCLTIDDNHAQGLNSDHCLDDFPQCFPAYCGEQLASCETDDLTRPECAAQFPDLPECFAPTDQVLTKTKTFTAQINATGGSILESIDFSAEDFVTPIEGRVAFNPTYVSALGLDLAGAQIAPRASCQSTTAPGTLDIGGLQIEMLNAHGGAVDTPVILDGTPMDGRERTCAATFTSEPTTWGGYALAIDAVSAEGDICFSNRAEPEPMRPDDPLGVFLARAYETVEDDDGSLVMRVPDSCRECEADDDCDPDEPNWACLEGVCQRPCELDRDCESSVLGDLGFTCNEIDGRTLSYCIPQVD
ncbi:MAG: hypothetical protein AAF799_32330 [Myxococcota bacterium]